MKIGILDIDGHNYPNLALMKISAYHKSQGDNVELFYGLNKYDIVYKSKVFTFTPDYEELIMADKIISGGTGFDLTNKLPLEIENQYPDYSLYNIKNTAYGFLTRGCPRSCNFCIVSKKEGNKSYKVADLSQFWKGQKNIEILDPNLLACKENKIELLNQLVGSNAIININQGFDIRFLDTDSLNIINKLKIKAIHFAWDNYEFDTYEKLKFWRDKIQFEERKTKVYILTNFNTTHKQDLERIYKLQELQYDPYVMIFNKINAPKIKKQIARWCNNKFIYRVCKNFKDYNNLQG